MPVLSEATAWQALRQVIDPEVGVNIVDLGLVYGLRIDGGRVAVDLTMTSPACPLGEYLIDEVTQSLRRLAGADDVTANLVWEPAWRPERMTDEGRRQLGWFGENDAPPRE